MADSDSLLRRVRTRRSFMIFEQLLHGQACTRLEHTDSSGTCVRC